MTKSIILLSGGLDSLVSLGLSKEKYNVTLALTFDYGQKSVVQEIQASKKICEYYGIEHKVIRLDWLKDITHTALVSEKELPQGIQDTSKSVWVPNRNGLFLNIAASFADGEDFDYILIGANKEEAETFSDNTKEFIARINAEFEYSTTKQPKVVAPLINYNKNDIVRQALDNDLPLELAYSCYQGSAKNCGICESCTRLKNALLANSDEKYIGILF
ncbi:MAG: 7-cyano-7-deazaguanine synthase QueC [Cyanobacteria bacterium SIG32]|nr:7-cyano-7-deazaguanine synthase QueC [Cyanobacteria bacterium SIG32]